MDKHFTMTVAALALALSGTSAWAGGGVNGLDPNGYQLNATTLNGVSLNGKFENGKFENGLSINGGGTNGLDPNGVGASGAVSTPAPHAGRTILDGFTIERVELPDRD